jgi:hypothetical protein
MRMPLLIKSLEIAGFSGKDTCSMFRSNFTSNLHDLTRYGSLSFTQDEGQRRDPNDQ